MTSKTALPIARLRSLGCKVSTLIGHDVPSPITGRYPGISAVWKYGVTLPPHVPHPPQSDTQQGRATAYWHQPTGRIIVQGVSPRPPADKDRATVKADRLKTEADVAGLLNALADRLSKA